MIERTLKTRFSFSFFSTTQLIHIVSRFRSYGWDVCFNSNLKSNLSTRYHLLIMGHSMLIGSPSREADSDVPEEEDSVETKDIRTNNSTLSRQAAYPTGCGYGRKGPSHLALRLVKEAFDTYSSTSARTEAVFRKFTEAKKNPRVVTVGTCLPWVWSFGRECVYYAGWYTTIYY